MTELMQRHPTCKRRTGRGGRDEHLSFPGIGCAEGAAAGAERLRRGNADVPSGAIEGAGDRAGIR